MTDTLLQTKFYVPGLRPSLVPRPHLIEKLNAGLGQSEGFPCKLTLISAPAGFGKTTLIADWGLRIAESTTLKLCWLSLDENDNDLARFLTYLVAALNQVEGLETTIGKGALGMLQSPQAPPTEAILISLINEVAVLPDKIIFVLDDYHVIDSLPVDDALTYLLEHLPPQMHLVIATRDDPQLPLARLRARGQLTELRAADLRFTHAEAVAFLNQMMGLDLSTENVAALETRTEGWIAGLQLAALALQGPISNSEKGDAASLIQSFTGSHRFVLDYLIEEVLEQQAESVQTFLLQTAVLKRLTAPLCDYLIADFGMRNAESTMSHSQAVLEQLEHANLFIILLDEERRWYRYHHLFADLLRQRLRQKQPDWIQTLHQRASEWYEQNGFLDEAIEHSLRAKDFERAAHLIEEHVDALWQRGRHTQLQRWLVKLPDELLFSKPHLCLLHAWDLFASGQQDAAERSIQAAETVVLEREQLSDFDKMKIQGRAAAIRAFLAFFRGDVQEIYKYSHMALEYLPEEDLTWRSTATVALGDAYSFIGDTEAAYRTRLEAYEASKAAGNIYMGLISSMKLAVTMRQQGRLEQVIEICQQQMQLANESGLSQTAVTGWVLAIWGEVLAELNDLDRAIDQVKNGTELVERGRDVAMIGWCYLCLIRVLFSRGELAGAEEIIQKMENTGQAYPPWLTSLIAAWQARIWLAQDKLDAASQWVGKRGLVADGEPTVLHEMEYIALARILIAQGQLDEATTLLQRLLQAAKAGGRTSRMIEILLLRALTSQAGGDTNQAMSAMERALTLAEPGGFIRIFVDEGSPMARLLYEALSHGITPDYVRQLLSAFPVSESEQATPAKTQSAIRDPKPVLNEAEGSEIIEPLSEREIEVLQLIAEGLTNRAIAKRLYLSLNTVKSHTRNIYGKLGVNNRTQAVFKARALGILPNI